MHTIAFHIANIMRDGKVVRLVEYTIVCATHPDKHTMQASTFSQYNIK